MTFAKAVALNEACRGVGFTRWPARRWVYPWAFAKTLASLFEACRSAKALASLVEVRRGRSIADGFASWPSRRFSHFSSKLAAALAGSPRGRYYVIRSSRRFWVESFRARILCNLRPLVAPSRPQELLQEAPGGICVICKPARRPASPRARILCNLRGQVDLRKPQKLSQLVFYEGKAAPGSQRIAAGVQARAQG